MPEDKKPKRKKSDAAMSGMVATGVLVVIALLTIVFVVIGG
jgi:hypothetical protein